MPGDEGAVAWAAMLVALMAWLTAFPVRVPVHAPAECAPPCGEAVALLFGETLDLNRASTESLEVLPGIGPARARAIVKEREKRSFRRVEDLVAVHGIGPRTVAGLKGWVSVASPPPDR